jgi:hypothetical protein
MVLGISAAVFNEGPISSGVLRGYWYVIWLKEAVKN